MALPLKGRITVYGVTPVQAGSCVVLQTEWDLVDIFFRLSVFNPNINLFCHVTVLLVK